MIKNTLFILLIISLASSIVLAEELSAPFMQISENMKVTTLEYKGSKELSKISIDVKKEASDQNNIFVVTKKGQGHIDKFDNVSWIIEAKLRNNQGFLETLDSVCRITDKKGKTLAVYKKLYDYQKKILVWESYDADGKLNKKKDFPIKGKTCDDTTLMFFLKAFVPNEDLGEQHFYLLTNEPKLFKTKIKFIGKEKLILPGGEIEAVKMKLTADIGILDDILDKFVPQTYMWYSASPPYHWLKYQGFEKDSGSHYVVKKIMGDTYLFPLFFFY